MLRKTFTFFAALLLSGAALAAGTPDQLVRETTDAMVKRLAADQAQIKASPAHVEQIVRDVVLPQIDSDGIARRVLAKHWRGADENQQKRFTVEFRDYLVRFYSRAFANYDGEKIELVGGAELDERGNALVRTNILRKNGQTIPVNYKLINEQSRWRVIDVVIEGISLVQSKRDEFGPMISSQGLDKVIAQLASKNVEGGK